MPDPSAAARKYLKEAIEANGLEMAPLSRALQHNHAYLQQYIESGTPRWLKEADRIALGAMIANLDTERLKEPPKASSPISSRRRPGTNGRDKPEVHPPISGKIVQDARTLELLDIWDEIESDEGRELALRVLRQFRTTSSAITG